MSNAKHQLTVLVVGGPTAVLEYGGLRFITDPTFDPPGSYSSRPGVTLTKTAGPALSPDDVGPVDAVLLSHDEHADNLDSLGRQYLARVPLVLTTAGGARRLGTATPLPPWVTVELPRPEGGKIGITGLPAQHGPDESEDPSREVVGFRLTGEGLPAVYVSGDNASLDVVRRIVERVGGADVGVINAGGAQLPIMGDAYLTLPGALVPEAGRLLGARAVVPIHIHGWQHFSDGAGELRAAFAAAGMSERLALVEPGSSITV